MCQSYSGDSSRQILNRSDICRVETTCFFSFKHTRLPRWDSRRFSTTSSFKFLVPPSTSASSQRTPLCTGNSLSISASPASADAGSTPQSTRARFIAALTMSNIWYFRMKRKSLLSIIPRYLPSPSTIGTEFRFIT